MLVDVDVYLDHHGVKGQRWGYRHEQRKAATEERRAIWKARPKNQKLALFGGAVVGNIVGSLLTSNGSTPLHLIGSFGGTYAGIKAVEAILDKNGNTPVPKLK